MKKLASILLVMALCLGLLVGCSQPATESEATTEETTSNETTESAEGKTIVIMGAARQFPGEEEAWEQVAQGFEEENPGYTVEIKWQGKWDEVVQNLSAAELAGEQVDLFQVGAGIIRQTFAPSGMAMDMTELIEPYKDRFVDGMFGGVTVGDHVWGIPLASSGTSAFYYNKTMFDELGLEEPETFEDLVEIANVIKTEKNITPMIHHGQVTSFWPMLFMETYAQTSGNNSIENTVEFLSGNASFEGEAEAEAFNLVKSFFDEGILTSDSYNTDTNAMRALFSQQKAAMFYGGTWEYAPIKSAVTDFEIGVFPFPLMVDEEGVIAQPGGGGGAGGLIIPSFADHENLDATMMFVEYLLRPENAEIVVSPTEPIIPTNKGVSLQQDDIIKELNDEFAPISIVFLDWYWPAEVTDSFKQNIPAVASGNMTAEEATADIQARYETIVKEKEYQFDWWNQWDDEDWAKVTPTVLPPSYAE